VADRVARWRRLEARAGASPRAPDPLAGAGDPAAAAGDAGAAAGHAGGAGRVRLAAAADADSALAGLSDTPLLFALLLLLVLAVVLAEIADGGIDAKAVAMLGVLTAVGAALRPLGTGIAGLEPVFFLLVLAGRVFGPGFGFVLGSTTLFASALITGGVGRGCRSRCWPPPGWAPVRGCCRRGCAGGASWRCWPATARSPGCCTAWRSTCRSGRSPWAARRPVVRGRRPGPRQPAPVRAFTLVTSLGFDLPGPR
jgi:hypothetical protein